MRSDFRVWGAQPALGLLRLGLRLSTGIIQQARFSWVIAIVITFEHAHAAAPASVAFSNFSTNELWVARVLCDGRESPIPVGILIPGQKKTSADMFPKRLPMTFAIHFRKDSQSLTQEVSGKEVSDLLKQAGRRGGLTVHFVYSYRGQFIPKVEARAGQGPNEELRLWPDENTPVFQKYKDLDRAARSGDAAAVQKALKDGAPFWWQDDPTTLSPLEWTVRWNHEAAFELLLNVLPKDYAPYRYANCIKLAAPSGNTNILRRLLAQELASQVPARELQDIFYEACYSARSPRGLEVILSHYKVGIDFRVRDYGHTLLFAAVQGGNSEVAEWLIQHGADRNATLQNGSRPIEFARDARIRALLSAPTNSPASTR